MATKVNAPNIREIKLSEIEIVKGFNARYDIGGDATVDPKTGEEVKIDTRASIDDFAKALESEGQQTPVRVWADGGKLKLVYGFRRFEAISMLNANKRKPKNLTSGMILAEVWEGSEKEAMVANLTENTQRNSLQTYELADRVKLLSDKHGYSIPELASLTGKSRGYLGNLMRVLKDVHADILTEWRKGKSGAVSNDLVVKWSALEHEKQLSAFKRKMGVKTPKEGGVGGNGEPRTPVGGGEVSNPRATVKEMVAAVDVIRGARIPQEVREGMIAALKWAAGKSDAIEMKDGSVVYDPEGEDDEVEDESDPFAL